jgi:hypothetical protein
MARTYGHADILSSFLVHRISTLPELTPSLPRQRLCPHITERTAETGTVHGYMRTRL